MTMPDDETLLVHTVAARLLDLLAETTTLPDLLDGICELTVEVVPGCTTASLTLLRDGVPATVASYDESAERVDQTQYTAGAGPCLEAARSDRLVVVEDVAAAGAMESWRRAAQDAGLRAMLSVPVPAGADFAAALNVYTDRAGWPGAGVAAAETLATYVGDALTVAYRLHDAESARRRGRRWTPSPRVARDLSA
jgi:GAF domain-containing protein